MSGMILCRTGQAKKPLYLHDIGTEIYSLEELCYYIYNNIYIITNDFLNENLLDFIRNDIGEQALADKLDELVAAQAGLAEAVVTILKYVDYYNVGEIEQMKDILKMLGTQNVYERMKSRADSFLGNKCYYSAIQNYDKIISGSRDMQLSGLFYAKVYHNMGVAYAKMFFYKKAAEFFKEAYKIGQHEESKKCFLAAERLAKGEDVIEDIESSEEICGVRKDMEQFMDNARYSDEYRELQNIDSLKTHGQVAAYYKAIGDCVQVWKKQYEKYTS